MVAPDGWSQGARVTPPTVIAPTRVDRAGTWLLLPGGGAALGAGAHAFRAFWLSQEWLPWQGPVRIADRLATRLDEWALPAFVALGIVAGLVLAVVAALEEVTVVVADDRVRIARRPSVREHLADDVREVLVEGGHLVLVARNGTDLSRTRTDLPAARLAAAFRAHGYHWVG